MEVLSAVPTVTVTEQLAVQPLADLAGARSLRANVWTLAPGDWSWGRHVHREQEELYLVLEGRLRVEAGAEPSSSARGRRSSCPRACRTSSGTPARTRSPTLPLRRRRRRETPLRPELRGRPVPASTSTARAQRTISVMTEQPQRRDNLDDLRATLKRIPNEPGVYRFLDAGGRRAVRGQGEGAAQARRQLPAPGGDAARAHGGDAVAGRRTSTGSSRHPSRRRSSWRTTSSRRSARRTISACATTRATRPSRSR